MTPLSALETPALVLDRTKLDANWERLSCHIARLGPVLRLHVKTAKSVEVVRRLHAGSPAPICVSTLKEAEVFASHGYRDILYTVALAPNKLSRAASLAAVSLATISARRARCRRATRCCSLMPTEGTPSAIGLVAARRKA